MVNKLVILPVIACLNIIYLFCGACDDVWQWEELRAFDLPVSFFSSSTIAYSPDGSLLAIASIFGNFILDTKTWETYRELGEPFEATSVSWSPDGKRVVFSHDSQMTVWDVDAGTLVWVRKEGGREVAWSPDGSLIAGSGIRFWDAKTGELVGVIEVRGSGGSVSWSPDSSRIATDVLGAITVWDVKSGELLTSGPRCSVSPVYSVRWSPLGDRIISGSVEGRVCMLDTSMSSLEDTLGSRTVTYAVEWSPDGEMFAAGEGWNIVFYGPPFHRLEGHQRTVYNYPQNLDQ